MMRTVHIRHRQLEGFRDFQHSLLLSLPPLMTSCTLVVSNVHHYNGDALLTRLSISECGPRRILSLGFSAPLLCKFRFDSFHVISRIVGRRRKYVTLLFSRVRVISN